jgi:hypothetical protein
MIIHVDQIKVKLPRENENSNSLEFDLHTTVGIYVSRACSKVIQQHHKLSKDNKLPIFKVSNITSSRRMISAIHNLREWSQHRSLLKPTIDDFYFQLPEGYDPSNIILTNGFNAAQSKTIAIAECMFDDLYDRMHIVHGPPGMLFAFKWEVHMYCRSFRYRQKSNDCRHRNETAVQIIRIRTETKNSALRSIKQRM